MEQNDQAFYEQYYSSQAGNGIDYYSGRNYMPRQYGNGIGNFLRPLGRMLTPLIKKGAKTVGRNLLSTGVDIVKDLIDGQSLKESAGMRFKETGRNMIGAIQSEFQPTKRVPRTRRPPARSPPVAAGMKRKRNVRRRTTKRTRARNIFQ